MKIWTLITDQDGINLAVHTTKAEADAQAVLIVTEWFNRYVAADEEERDNEEPRDHTDWQETYEILCEVDKFYHTIVMEEHDVSGPVDEYQTSDEAAAYRKGVRTREGSVEVHDDALVNLGDDDGAYVQAWIWVDAADAGLDPKCDTCGKRYSDGGDGFDGECPDCADKSDPDFEDIIVIEPAPETPPSPLPTFTVIVREQGLPAARDPLIYAIQIENLDNEEKVLRAVTRERFKDLYGEIGDDITENHIDIVNLEKDLVLLFAFEGDCRTAEDWRD